MRSGIKNKTHIAGFLFALFLTVGMCPVTAFAAEDGATATSGVVSTESGKLNVRSGAGMDYSVIALLADGTEVEIISIEDGWAQITLPEGTGYVSMDYLTVTEEESEDGEVQEVAVYIEVDASALPDGVTVESDESSETQEAGLTPDGNLTLVDDLGDVDESGKQFITLVTKNGNYFYLIIDRDSDGEETVHFLNQVDEADLLALMDEEEAEEYQENKAAGAAAAEEKAAEAQAAVEEELSEGVETEEQEESGTGANYLPAVGTLVVLLIVGAGYVLFKFKDKKKAQKSTVDPDADYEEDVDEYDFPEEQETDLYDEEEFSEEELSDDEPV